MQPEAPISDMAHIIQLAIAPVFLLTGIAALLGVLVNRLSRIIDRARLLEGHLSSVTGEFRSVLGSDLHMLGRRARYANQAISLFTASALLVCVMIAVLFLSALFGADIAQFVAALFVLAMLGLIAGLVSFLREIYLATQSFRIGPH